MAETTGPEPETRQGKSTEGDTDQPKAPAGREETLWLLAFAPLMWMVYFLLCYVTAAIWCEKVVGRSGSLDGARLAIALYTIATLIGIGLVIWRGYNKHRFGTGELPHDADSASDRHRFLGFATVLIGGLSAVATVYTALTILLIDSCA